jgi:hypothetical protein
MKRLPGNGWQTVKAVRFQRSLGTQHPTARSFAAAGVMHIFTHRFVNKGSKCAQYVKCRPDTTVCKER